MQAGDGGQPLPEGGRGGLAADHEHGRAVPPLVQDPFGDEDFEVGGGEVEVVDALAVEVGGQGGRVPVGGVVQQVELVAVDHPEHRVPGGVEGERGAVGDAQALAAGAAHGGGDVVLGEAGVQVGERGVGDHHALGAAGGARGVQHVGSVVELWRGQGARRLAVRVTVGRVHLHGG